MRIKPFYDPDALRESIQVVDKSIKRIKESIKNLNKQNEAFRQQISSNKDNINIFYNEIAKIENQKKEMVSLLSDINKGK